MSDQTFINWPFFQPQHHELKAALDRWCASATGSLVDETGGVDASCRRLVALLGQTGWLQHTIAKTSAGASERLDVRSLCLCRETLAYFSGLADFSFAMQGLGSGPISLFGNRMQKQAYLPAVAAGDSIAAFALSEKEAGSDVSATSTTARRDGDRFVLDGEKTWISNGGIADFYIVFARTGEAPGAKGLSAFIVDADTPGLEITERIEVIAPHPLATLRFENCRVATDRMLGNGGDGFKIAMATLDVFRSTVGAAALGFARRALDEALERVKTRRLFSQRLADLQMTQASIADMAVEIDASALLIYRSAWTKDQANVRVTREAAMAKLFATEAAQRVIDQAVQLFGGLGVVSGVPVERLYREIRALRIYEGTSELQRVIIARQTLEAA